MDPFKLIPQPDAIPAPWGLFSILLALTFTLHIIAANALLGAGFFSLLDRVRGKPDDGFGKEMASKLPMTIAITVNMGVAPLLFLQVMYGQFVYVSYVLMAVYWLSIFILLIIAYYSAYIYNFKYEGLGSAGVFLIGLLVVLTLLVGFFFTNSLLLMIDPESWLGYFENRSGVNLNTGEPTIIPRFLHFVVASVAMGGLAISLLAWWRERKGIPDTGERIRRGLLVFACATVFQFIIGTWYLGMLPGEALEKVMLSDSLSFPFFMISIVAALASIIFSFSGKPIETLISTALTVFFMVLFRNGVRAAYLESYKTASPTEVVIQLGPIIMFLVALLIGLACVGYMLKLVFCSGKEEAL